MDIMMEFPKSWEEFVDGYKFVDTEQVYTNGSELIQVLRVKQMMQHYLPATDVAEVRHGRWVAESYYAGPMKMWGWKCTACGAFSPVNEVKFYKFCPGCGAKMCEAGKG